MLVQTASLLTEMLLPKLKLAKRPTSVSRRWKLDHEPSFPNGKYLSVNKDASNMKVICQW